MAAPTSRPETPEPADAVLLARVAVHDRDAFTELYRRYAQRIYRYVFKVIRRDDLVDEVVDDVMMAVWRGADRFEGRSRVSTWIFGTAYRQALKALERSNRHARREEPLEDEWTDRQAGPENLMARKEMATVLGRALAKLSPTQRSVVELTYFHECSYPEIAEIMGCPVNSVKTRMFHARRKLRRILPREGVADSLGRPERSDR